MDIILIIIILLVIGIVTFINSITNKSLEMLLEPQHVLTKIDPDEPIEVTSAIESFHQWAQHHGFVHDINFHYHTVNPDAPMICSAWWSDSAKTWALLSSTPELHNIDFVTIYSDALGVTTSSTKDAVMIPDIPTAYKQAFVGLTPDELYQKHNDARTIIEHHESVSLPERKDDLLHLMASAMVRQAKYVMHVPFWKFRGVFWYVWRRNMLVNTPISPTNASQHTTTDRHDEE